MKHSLRNKLHGSVFFHILAAILATGLAVILLSGLFIGMVVHRGSENPFEKNLHTYANYIVQDLGAPPSANRAQTLAKNLYLDIRYEGQAVSWTTSDKLPSIAEAERTLKRHKKAHHHAYIVISNQTGKFLFRPNFKNASQPISPITVILFLLLLALLFFCSWLWIKWILKPLVLLNDGVNALSQGRLDHEIPIKRKDELGKLAKSFNHMTTRLREMLKNKDQLLLDVSHEIRSPLTRMKVALELLPNSQNKSSIAEDANDMERMINKILEAGKIENTYLVPQKISLSLTDLIQKVMKNYSAQDTKVIYETPAEPVTILADPEQIQAILENIIENACKYSNPESEPVRIRLDKEASRIIVTVQDNGIGIPENHLPRVFEPFYRVDPSRAKTTGGFGLGLSICKRIMEMHNGTIQIKSEVGTGTEVSLIFQIG
jgi:signal transduction histidine kinase